MRLTGRQASSGLVIWMLMRTNGASLDRGREISDGQTGYGVGPGQFRLDAVLHRRWDLGRLIEAADRYGNPVPARDEIAQRRAAFGAKSALGNVGAGEGLWRPARPDEAGHWYAGERHE